MGMFDKPQYLTGKDGFVSEGDTFYIHGAMLDGTTTVNNEQREQAKLRVSKDENGEKVVVYTSGRGVVNQIRRMDAADRNNMPMHVRLDSIPAQQAGRNPTHVLTPADQDPPTTTVSDSDNGW